MCCFSVVGSGDSVLMRSSSVAAVGVGSDARSAQSECLMHGDRLLSSCVCSRGYRQLYVFALALARYLMKTCRARYSGAGAYRSRLLLGIIVHCGSTLEQAQQLQARHYRSDNYLLCSVGILLDNPNNPEDMCGTTDIACLEMWDSALDFMTHFDLQ